MGKVTGFIDYEREVATRRPVEERVNDWFEIYQPFSYEKVRTQGARCMDCGVPFCHTGCPLNNIIPDWNDLAYKDRWKDAIRVLHSTNNFPEFTGRVCPAPCESACVLGINEPAVAIKLIERSIIDYAFEQGWIKPEPPEARTGKRVAVVGSGPAGMAAAQQLNRAGHTVVVYEKSDRVGGLLRYGIPDFKMEKHHIDRRVEQLEAEGVEFVVNAHVGVTVPVEELRAKFDAVMVAGGAENSRDLTIPGRDLKGIHFAMDFLPQQNHRGAGDAVDPAVSVTAAGRDVIIIGGGDTGADCLGTSHRHKAKSVHQFELMQRPPDERSANTPWPMWPVMMRTESSHEEGGLREFAISTKEFVDDGNGNVKALRTVRVGPPPTFAEIPNSEQLFTADLVLLAMGFTGPVKNGLLTDLGVELDNRGNVKTNEPYMSQLTSVRFHRKQWIRCAVSTCWYWTACVSRNIPRISGWTRRLSTSRRSSPGELT